MESSKPGDIADTNRSEQHFKASRVVEVYLAHQQVLTSVAIWLYPATCLVLTKPIYELL